MSVKTFVAILVLLASPAMGAIVRSFLAALPRHSRSAAAVSHLLPQSHFASRSFISSGKGGITGRPAEKIFKVFPAEQSGNKITTGSVAAAAAVGAAGITNALISTGGDAPAAAPAAPVSPAVPIPGRRQLLKIFQVDAFADEPYCGNPAAIVRVSEEYGLPETPPYSLKHPPQTGEAEQEWVWPGLSVPKMQKIANEKNLSETAFYVIDHAKTDSEEDGKTLYAYLRWFTPTKEVQLCGHGTLATAYLIFLSENAAKGKNKIVFTTKYKGNLVVEKAEERLWQAVEVDEDTGFPVGPQNLPLKMSLPLDETKPLVEQKHDGAGGDDDLVFHDDAARKKWDGLCKSCFQHQVRPKALLRSRQEKEFDHVLVFETAEEIEHLEPNHEALKEVLPKNEGCRALICTAPGGAGRRILRTGSAGATAEGEDGGGAALLYPDRHCVSRVYAPIIEVFEDPVTGSAHATIVSYWSRRLGLDGTPLRARQIHPSRPGNVVCEWAEGQATVALVGRAALVESGGKIAV